MVAKEVDSIIDKYLKAGIIKRFTRALHAATSRGKGDREAPDKQGTGTKAKIDTFPFPGNNCRSCLYSDTATTGAAADVRVQNRDNITRINDVEQSLKDLIVRSQPRFGDEDSQEEKLGGGKSLVTQAAIDDMLRRGAAYMQI